MAYLTIQPIVAAPADAVAVDEHGIGPVRVDLLHDPAGDLHEVRDAERHRRDRARRMNKCALHEQPGAA
jgi:hypothetical protein